MNKNPSMHNNTPQSILPFDEEYILIRKRRFIAGNMAMASMAKYISAIQNVPMPQIITKFAQFGVNEAEAMPKELLDQSIQTVMDAASEAAR